MTLQETLQGLQKGLNKFKDKHHYLLVKNIAERSITHKLAECLTEFFPEFHVDCEYNGDIDNPDGYRKTLGISVEEMIGIARRKIREDETYAVYPDIIIHRRNGNLHNHVVIEVKKEHHPSSDQDFDMLKHQKFTTQYNYKLGVYLVLRMGEDYGVISTVYFRRGEIIEESKLEKF